MLVIPSRVIATCFALVAFSSAAAVGVVAGNSPSTIIIRATAVMLVSWIIGRIIGAIAQQAVDDHITRFKKKHPIPDQLHLQDKVAAKSDQDSGLAGDVEPEQVAVPS